MPSPVALRTCEGTGGRVCVYSMDKGLPTDSLDPLIKAPSGIYRIGMALENHLDKLGFLNIAGIDEAGRGPLAGPVVAAAVILNRKNIPEGLDDSKKLSALKREHIFLDIIGSATVAIAAVPPSIIDAINIRQATLLAMKNVVFALSRQTDYCLFDGRDIPPGTGENCSAVIKGDGRSKSIAAASIIAKVTRDDIMKRASLLWPQYGFEKHKGYGTLAHRKAIAEHGTCPIHRHSFKLLATKVDN